MRATGRGGEVGADSLGESGGLGSEGGGEGFGYRDVGECVGGMARGQGVCNLRKAERRGSVRKTTWVTEELVANCAIR